MKISIVTPSFNQASFLEETILSVIGQDYDDLEYIVVDGGSTDGSDEIIRQHSNRLHYWTSEKDDGHAHALSKGFARTSGEIMAWLNSDDKYLPWTFRVVSTIFAKFPNVNWLVGFNAFWNQDGVMTHAKKVRKNVYDFLLGDFEWIQQESVFWRRSLWEAAGGRVSQDYRFMVDGELWSRFFLIDQPYHIDCILSGYRKHSTNRALQHYPQTIQEMREIVQIMEQRCPPEVLRNCRDIRLARRVPLYKHLAKHALRKARYRDIRYQNGEWVEKSRKFAP